MRRFTIGLIALLAAAPASAQTLWGNIELGMAADQVKALYPAQRLQARPDRTLVKGYKLIKQCKADIDVRHPGGRVDQVVVRGEPAILGQCSAAILQAMIENLGTPVSAVTSRPSLLKRERTTLVWEKGGTVLRFVRYSTDGPGGSGLGAPSWTLNVSVKARGA
jgi:hypothetical protein